MVRGLAALVEDGGVDGVYLDIHGAMSVVGRDDAEGDLVTALRQVVGPEVLVAAPMDLHGNLSPVLARELDLPTCYRMARARGRLADAGALRPGPGGLARAGRAAGAGVGAGADPARWGADLHPGGTGPEPVWAAAGGDRSFRGDRCRHLGGVCLGGRTTLPCDRAGDRVGRGSGDICGGGGGRPAVAGAGGVRRRGPDRHVRQVGRPHGLTPVTGRSRLPSRA